MFNNTAFMRAIKIASTDAVEATKPALIVFGKVVSTAPLKINVEQKLTLTSAQLVLTRNVTDFETDMTVDHLTEIATINLTDDETSHKHEVPSIDTEITDLKHSHSSGGVPSSTESPSSKHIHTVPVNTTGTGSFSSSDVGEHLHRYLGRKTFLVHNSLVVGDEVLLVRMQGGQKYVVIDRIVGI